MPRATSRRTTMRKAVFVFLLLSASSLFAQDWRGRRYERYRDDQVDLTPFLGYRYGGTLYADQSNLFAASAAIGVKVPLQRNLAIRVEERGFYTSMSNYDNRCRACYYNYDYNHDLVQGETNVGLDFKF